MTLGDLLEVVEGMVEDYGEDTEVRIASQPNYPFEYDVRGIVGCLDDPVLSNHLEDGDDPRVVWIVEGNQIGYFTKDAWNLC